MKNQGKVTGLSIAAFVLSMLGCTSLIGIILGIVDLAHKDGRSKELSIVAISFGIIMTAVVGCSAIKSHMFENEPEIAQPVRSVIDFRLPSAPVYEPEKSPTPSPTLIPKEMTL